MENNKRRQQQPNKKECYCIWIEHKISIWLAESKFISTVYACSSSSIDYIPSGRSDSRFVFLLSNIRYSSCCIRCCDTAVYDLKAKEKFEIGDGNVERQQ